LVMRSLMVWLERIRCRSAPDGGLQDDDFPRLLGTFSWDN